MQADSVRCFNLEALERRTLFSAPVQWSSRGPGGGGAMFSPSFSDRNPSEIFLATDMSELFHSTDSGANWTYPHFSEIQAGRESRVQFTNDPNVLYTLDYSDLPDGNTATRPSRSNDGGATWSPLAGWDESDEAFYLYADPINASRLIVSDYMDLYFSSDGGQTFTSKFTAPDDDFGCFVAGAFFDGQKIYVGTNSGLLISTNGGASFAPSTAGGISSTQAMFSMAGAKQNGVTRLMCVTLPGDDVYGGLTIEGAVDDYQSIYAIDSGQTSWTPRTTGIAAGDRPSFVAMARNNINIAYVAGGSTGSAPTVSKTINGGASWSRMLVTNNNQNVITGWQGQNGDRGWSFGELALGFAVAPTNPNVLCWTDLGMVHLSTDGGTNWRQIYTSPADQNPANANTPAHKAYHGVGLEDTSAHWLNWTDANTMQAGYTDIIGVRSTSAGASWSFPTFGLSTNSIYDIVKNTGSSTLYAASSSIHDIYQSTHLMDGNLNNGTGALLFSNDAGATWSLLHDFADPVVWCATDPTNVNRMYVSVVHSTLGGIYVTNNLNLGTTSTWTKVTNPPRTEGHPFNIRVLTDGSVVATYSGRRSGSSFTNSSGVFISANQGTSWTDRTDAVLSGMKYWTKDITIDPTDSSQNTWWCAVRSGFGGTGNGMGGLYKTTNRGVSWTRVFSTASVESCTIDPATKEMYVATTSAGLWYAPNVSTITGNASFTQTSFPFRQPERIFINPFNTNEVWIASFGWGLAVGNTGAGAGTISGKVFNDVDQDRVRGASEGGIGNITVFLDANANGLLDVSEKRAMTDPSGNYQFTGMSTASYVVAISQPLDYRRTSPVRGTYEVNVGANGVVNNIDFGEARRPQVIAATPAPEAPFGVVILRRVAMQLLRDQESLVVGIEGLE